MKRAGLRRDSMLIMDQRVVLMMKLELVMLVMLRE
jgi:hypothetical protein